MRRAVDLPTVFFSPCPQNALLKRKEKIVSNRYVEYNIFTKTIRVNLILFLSRYCLAPALPYISNNDSFRGKILLFFFFHSIVRPCHYNTRWRAGHETAAAIVITRSPSVSMDMTASEIDAAGKNPRDISLPLLLPQPLLL